MKKLASYVLALTLLFSFALGAIPAYAASNTPTLAIITEPVYEMEPEYCDGVGFALWLQDNTLLCAYLDENGSIIVDKTKMAQIYYYGFPEDSTEMFGAENKNSLLTDVNFYTYFAKNFHDGLLELNYYVLDSDIDDDYFTQTVYINKFGEYQFSVWGRGGAFSDGIALCYDEDELLAGTINIEGQIVGISEKYIPTGIYSEGLIPVKDIAKLGPSLIFQDEYGNEIDRIDNTQRAGYVNKEFNIVISLQFYGALPFFDGYALVSVMGEDGEVMGLIDKSGKFIVPPSTMPQLDKVKEYNGRYINNGIMVMQKDNYYGFMDVATGKMITQIEWDSCGMFSGGYASVKKNGKWGYINTKGTVVIKPQYDFAGTFYNGAALVESNGTYKLIDEDGNSVSSKTWCFEDVYISDASPHMVSYKQNGKWGIAKIIVPEKPSTWAVDYINRAIALNLVPPQFQGNYTSPSTRAEFCALAVCLYELVTGNEITELATFTDTTDINVQKMAGLGVVSGVGNNRFDPNSALTREQAAVILDRLMAALGKPLGTSAPAFADNASISSWATGAVGNTQALGIMSGTGNNNFSPKKTYTREQCITTILRVYDAASSGGIGGE